jgi:hypothetical protein
MQAAGATRRRLLPLPIPRPLAGLADALDRGRLLNVIEQTSYFAVSKPMRDPRCRAG